MPVIICNQKDATTDLIGMGCDSYRQIYCTQGRYIILSLMIFLCHRNASRDALVLYVGSAFGSACSQICAFIWVPVLNQQQFHLRVPLCLSLADLPCVYYFQHRLAGLSNG